jgi:hypothetical protein
MYPSTYQNKEIVNNSKDGDARILALSLAFPSASKEIA